MAVSKPDFARIKELFEKMSVLHGSIEKIALFRKKQEAAAAVCLRKMRAEEAQALLTRMDVDSINRDKLGFRVSALRSAGITNMQQLCALSRNQLCNIHGISEEAAYIIHKIARQIAREAEESVRPRLIPEEKSPESTELIRILYRDAASEDSVLRASELHAKYGAEISAALHGAKPAASQLSWLISSGRVKEQALQHAGRLELLLRGSYGAEAVSIIRDFKAAAQADAGQCWADFEANAAAYYSRLEKLDVSSVPTVDTGKARLPAQLVEQVERQPLYLDGLRATLRSYQDFGARYIISQGKVLLGDEMGLGKTVQAIAAMVSLSNQGASHFMVVCPAGVLVNWAREISKFSNLSVTGIRGGDMNAVNRWLETGGVAVSSYDSISRFTLPQGFEFAMLIADEAHYAKNPGAIRTQALNRLACAARRCLYMTGTPLENRVDEMCYLISCLRPDIAKKLEGIKYYSSAARFREEISPVYLRRTREDVLTELPELIENTEWCDLTLEEAKHYYANVITSNFMGMRQVSWQIPDVKKSSKAQRLLEIQEAAELEGRKLLVFSFFRSTIGKVCALLGDKCLEPVTGSMAPAKRQEIIDRFSSAPAGAVLVCQIQAGGTGLNIQSASVVVFCEPQIKPSLETQAVSRAYRMGQIRNVLVYRLLCDDTVDERIVELLNEKQDAFDSFADESAAGSEYVKSEQSFAAAIIAQEKARLENAP